MVDSAEPLTSCAACGIAFPLGARFCPSCGVPLETAPGQTVPAVRDLTSTADPLIGQVIAERYRILSLLGRGGMGVVYRVEHVHIGKLMAMKLLSGELASDPVTLKRFQREARAVSKLAHPNTVQIFDFGESAHLAYLVMEYLPGRDLAKLIEERGALLFERAARIGAQIAGSVEEAHQSGIIHRDIKPENVMVLDTPEQRDLVKVLDFGIAKLRDVDEGSLATQRGHLIGTPYYMAPEHIRGEPIDHRVDIYALGALMYKAVTGYAPFEADTPLEVLGKHLNEPLVPARRRAPSRDIPEQADRILAKALAKDPRDRYASMAALRDALLGYLSSLGLDGDAPRTAPVGRMRTLATRGDVDRYERRISRTSRFGKGALVLLLLVAAYGAYMLTTVRREPSVDRVEREPNDTPSLATALVPGNPLRAWIGKRRSPKEGDVDIYRIERPRAEANDANDARTLADISVTALPNIDLALDLVEKGSPQPVLVVNTGALGEPERIPNFALRADTYYLRVREVGGGPFPTENVSDAYTITLALSAARAGEERELNDGFERAHVLTPGQPVRGRIGWANDRDVYCAAPTAAAQRVEVTGVPDVDLVLAYLDRNTNAGQRIDRLGPGGGERIELQAARAPRRACFTVSARERDRARRADPEHPYELLLR